MKTLEASERDRLLKPSEIRAEFGVSATTIRDWDKAGTLPAAQRTPGGHRRYRESVVRALLTELKALAVSEAAA